MYEVIHYLSPEHLSNPITLVTQYWEPDSLTPVFTFPQTFSSAWNAPPLANSYSPFQNQLSYHIFLRVFADIPTLPV